MNTLGLALVATLALTSTSAQAATYKVCVRYGVDLMDADTGGGDDFLNDNSAPLSAYGAHIQVKVQSTGVLVKQGFANTSGTYAGCIEDVTASAGTAYTIRVDSRAVIGGNTVEILDNDTSAQVYSQVWVWGPGAFDVVTATTDTEDYWNVAASAGQAAVRESGWLSGETWRWGPGRNFGHAAEATTKAPCLRGQDASPRTR